ncbi:ankyrin, partial [Glonium stellatum]
MVDALDECTEDERHQVIGFLTRLTCVLPHAKVFITSRKETDIFEAFQQIKTPSIKIEAENVAEDISNFLHAEVKRLRQGHNGKRLYIASDHLEERIVTTLSEKAEGMFLWAQLQLENIRVISKSRNDRDVESALQQTPKTLEETYKRIVSQIDDQPENIKLLALQSLMWVLYSKRPLSQDELQNAVAIRHPIKSCRELDLPNFEAILDACANLIEAVREGIDWIIRPIHYSVQEFFTDPSSKILRGSYLSPLQERGFIHGRLTHSCLCYLHLDRLKEGPARSCATLHIRLREHPFLWYSAQSFDYHIQCVVDLPESVLELLEAVLRCDTSYLAALLQAKLVRNLALEELLVHFRPLAFPVNASSIIFSTTLYNIPEIRLQFSDTAVPKYALHLACDFDQPAAVIHLLENGYDIHECDDDGAMPLYYACLRGNEDICEQLLEAGADVNAQGGRYYGNALQAASFSGDNKIVERLLQAGADVNA